jgi:hypothetical protein
MSIKYETSHRLYRFVLLSNKRNQKRREKKKEKTIFLKVDVTTSVLVYE